MNMAATELLRPAFLTVLFIVLASSDISEDVSVSYHVNLHPSAERFLIEYESMDRGRYRRQATGQNLTTVPPPTTQASTTRLPTTTAQSIEAPQTNVPTVANTSTPRQTTTPRPTTSPAPQTHSKPPTTTAPPVTGSSTPTPTIKEGSHQYYRSQIIPNGLPDLWIDLSEAKKHATLSESHRTAVTINLGFKFRFYGHNITNVTIATGGFLYASPFLHQWLTATQYIAPLMANFDLRIGENSDVVYDDFGDKFAVQWRNVILKDQNSTGSFDFQAQLHADGTIKFLYKQLPIQVTSISSNNHPVKIGLSDAFYIDTYIKEKGIRRRTIYEYHRVTFHGDQIDQGTVIVMTPLPTCNVIKDCRDCVNHEDVAFECKWCGAVGRCSDGIDWHRSQWINSGCTKLAISNETLCDVTTTTKSTTSQTTFKSTTSTTTTVMSTANKTTMATFKSTTSTTTTVMSTANKTTMAQSTTSATAKGSSHSKCDRNITDGVCRGIEEDFPTGAVVAAVLILLVVFGGIGVWIFYAYTHPTSASGMWLMEHRPSQMKSKIANIKFWKSSTPAGTKYAVESTA